MSEGINVMSEGFHVCQICLRVDRKLREIDKRLTEFHDELCDFSVDTEHPQYCFECEHLLKKLFNFRNKCVRAMKVLNKWKNTKSSDKKHLRNLHTLLPESALGPWTAKKSLIFVTKSDQEIKDEPTSEPQLVDNIIKLAMLKSKAQTRKTVLETANVTKKVLNNQEDTRRSKRESTIPIIPNKSVIVKSNETEEELRVNQAVESILDSKESAGSLFYYLLPKKAGAAAEPVVKKLNLKMEDPSKLGGSEHNYSKIDEESAQKILNQAIKLEEDCELTTIQYEDAPTIKSETKQEDDVKTIKNDDYVYYDYLDDNFLYSEDIEETNDVPMGSDQDISHYDGNNQAEEAADEKPNITEGDEFYPSDDNINSDDDFDITAVDVTSSHKTVNREKLKAEMTELFMYCGELTDDEGNEIDKDYVLSCLDEKVSEYMWRRLWKVVHGQQISTRSIQLFNLIQTHSKLDAEIKNCDVEYLNTKQKVIEEFERRKGYEWYKNAKYKCEICYIPYNYEQILNAHMRHHYNDTGKFTCTLCSLRYDKRNDLLKHMHNHEVIYKCQICPMATYYRTSMQTHSDKHLGKQYHCGQCDTKFNCLSWFYKHVAKAHGRTYICTICAAAFFTEDKLNAHVAKHEIKPLPDDDTSVQCDKCDLYFISQEVYEKHLRITHNQTKKKGRYKKKSEDGKFPSASLMACRVPGCNLRGYYGTLVYHFRTDHPDIDMEMLYADTKKHLCEICGTGYTSPYHLRYHMNKHTGALPYPCPLCSKRFHSPQALKHHELFHKPRSKPCAVCGKLFRTTSNLYNHMRFHLQDRRYKCGICSKGFMHRNSLNEHIRGVHHHVRRNRKRDGSEVANESTRKGDTKTKVTEELIRGVLEARVNEARARGITKARASQANKGQGNEALRGVIEAKVAEAHARGSRPRYIEAGGEMYEVQDVGVSDEESAMRMSSDYSDNSDVSSDNEM